MSRFNQRKKIISHRCPASLAAHVSIRYGNPYAPYSSPSDIGWYLAQAETDTEYGVTFLSTFGRIAYCPYCGIKLLPPASGNSKPDTGG